MLACPSISKHLYCCAFVRVKRWRLYGVGLQMPCVLVILALALRICTVALVKRKRTLVLAKRACVNVRQQRQLTSAAYVAYVSLRQQLTSAYAALVFVLLHQ